MKLNNILISKKLSLVFFTIVFVTSAVGVASFLSLRSLEKSIELNDVLVEAEKHLSHVESETIRLGYLANLYLLTAHQADLDKYHALIDGLPEHLEEFETHIHYSFHADEIRTKFDEVKSNLTRWNEDWLLPQFDLMRNSETVYSAKSMQLLPDATSYADRSIALTNEIYHLLEDDIKQAHVEMYRAENFMRATFITGTFITVLICLISGYMVIVGISRPIQQLNKTALRLAKRDWDVSIGHEGRGDEVGQLAATLSTLRDAGREADRLAEQQRQEDAAKLKRAETINSLIASFEKDAGAVIQSLATAAAQMGQASSTMEQKVVETQSMTTTVAAAAEQAGMNVQTVASAAEQMTSSIQEISRQLQKSNAETEQASTKATNALDVIRELDQSARQIGDIIGIINEIAEQTNLLALNATIEAARSGEAGKGFAVVANEVKALATETAKATDQIKTNITAIQDKTNMAVDAIQDVNLAIRELTEASVSISSAMEEQSVTTQEIAKNVSEAASGTATVVQNIHTVNDNTRHTEQAAKEVLHVSDDVNRNASSIRESIEQFLKGIRSA